LASRTPTSSARELLYTPPKKATRPVSLTLRLRVPRSPQTLGSARNAVFVAGKARAVFQLERTKRFRQRLPHPRLGLVEQDRADVHATGGHHPAGRALELFGL